MSAVNRGRRAGWRRNEYIPVPAAVPGVETQQPRQAELGARHGDAVLEQMKAMHREDQERLKEITAKEASAPGR